VNDKPKRQKRKKGDVLQIDLGDGFHSYARVLEEALFAFYDSRTANDLPVDQIIFCPILLSIAVMNHAVTRGRWKIVGHIPLEETLVVPRPRFIQDALKPESFSIYERGAIRPATREECIGLECAAVWDPTHAEDRIRDHYLGRKNKWLESLKIKER
jgi:hypothetical protein